MAQTKLLADTNIYLAIGQHIDPILGETFCEEDYALYLCDNFYKEYDRNDRLTKKFGWVDDTPYRQNRKELQLSNSDKKEIDSKTNDIAEWQNNFRYMLIEDGDDPENAPELKPQEADRYILATAIIAKTTLVTDDKDLIALSKQFLVKAITIFDLFRLMLDCEFLDIKRLDDLSQIIGIMDRSNSQAWHKQYLECQSALKVDPSSASKFDPPRTWFSGVGGRLFRGRRQGREWREPGGRPEFPTLPPTLMRPALGAVPCLVSASSFHCLFR